MFIGFIWGGFLATDGDFWTFISCIISFLSLLCVVFIYRKWEEQVLITKRHDEYQECLLLLTRFFTLSSNLIETKKHEYWLLSNNKSLTPDNRLLTPYDVCDQLCGFKDGNRHVIEARKAFADINLEVICRRELMSAMLGSGSNCFLESLESFRAITAELAFSNYEAITPKHDLTMWPSKAQLCVTDSVLDDSKVRSMLDNWDYDNSDGKLTIEFNLKDYEKLHENFKSIICCFRNDFKDLSTRYIKNIT